MPIPAGSGTPTPPSSGPLFYDPVLSRVRLVVSDVPAAPMLVERSIDGVRWTTVRGGSAVQPAGGLLRLDDYEFAADVANYYRVTGPAVAEAFDNAVTGGWGPDWVTSGGATSDFNVAGGVGQLTLNTTNVVRNALRDVAVSDGTVRAEVTVPVTPTGGPITVWVPFRANGANDYYAAAVTIGEDGTSTVSIAKRIAGILTTLTSLVIVGTHDPGLPWQISFDVAGSALRALAYQSGDEPDWQVTATDTDITSGTLSGVLSRRQLNNTNGTVIVSVDNFVLTSPLAALYEGSIVPALGRVWLKSIARPFLNRQVTVVDYSDVERPSRAGIFDVVGRSLPVSVNDVRGSRRWALEVLTGTADDSEDLELLLASGDVLFVHAPAGTGVPGGYVVVGDTRQRRTSRLGARRVFELPCTEVAAPGPDVIGSTVTCQGVLNAYPTCTAVLAAHDTCLSLMELIGDPTDVIVP